MEGESVEMMGNSSNGGQGNNGNSRWNPTKEQISLLESLYKQGIRTPTADQIQQITARLKAFGHIEGKNVFYWFQNHKARQRQKQKQEILGYNNRFLHKHPIFASPCTNVVRGPYYLPQMDIGFYPQYPKVLIPSSFKRKPRTEKTEQKARSYETVMETVMAKECCNNKNYMNYQETLPLFPLHPTGVLKGNNATSGTFSEIRTHGVEEESSNAKLPFFDFFSGGSSF